MADAIGAGRGPLTFGRIGDKSKLKRGETVDVEALLCCTGARSRMQL